MDLLLKTARIYNRKIFPKIRNIRGSTFISRNLARIALKFADKTEHIHIDGIIISKKIYDLDEKIARRVISGSYELTEVMMIKKTDIEDSNVLELGGGIGYISCLVNSKLPNDNVHIVVEPNSNIIDILKENRDLNGFNFDIVEKAYSPNQEKLDLNLDEGLFFEGTVINNQDSEEGKVDGASLLEITEGFDLNQFGLILDIEGSEYDMLNEELTILDDMCSWALIEFHEGYGFEVEDEIDKLVDMGFKILDKEGLVYRIAK